MKPLLPFFLLLFTAAHSLCAQTFKLKRWGLLCNLLLVTSFSYSQQTDQLINSGADLTKYLHGTSFPHRCFYSKKFDEILRSRTKNKWGHYDNISNEEFNKLNFLEHFIHSMDYPEWYYQSCSMFGYEMNTLEKIHSFLPMQGEGFRMSERQSEIIESNRDSTIALLNKCIIKREFISQDYKRVIVNLQGYELIPELINKLNIENKVKDPYILTVLCLLMRMDYPLFREAKIYNELYGDSSANFVFSRARHELAISFTQNNYDTIVAYATNYYNLKKSKPGDFVKIQGGKYYVGDTNHLLNPYRKTSLKSYEISRYEITNRQFELFVKSTGYVTLAEQGKDAFVFEPGLDEFEWIHDSTAYWRFPNGQTRGGIIDKMDHPVTCISFIDAEAYCKWAKVRLPTFDEWEVAARGNSTLGRYFFGDTNDSISVYANVWKGTSHLMVSKTEDYLTTSPVGSYKENPLGLYDIYGNVFEFCSGIPDAMKDYQNIAVTRGGSWWCSKTACSFFNSVDIGRVKKEASFSNNGFRVVR